MNTTSTPHYTTDKPVSLNVIRKRSLGSIVKTLRENRDLTKTELAKSARCSPSTISSLEGAKYKRSPLLATAIRVALAMNVKPWQLVRDYEMATRKLANANFVTTKDDLRSRVQNAYVDCTVRKMLKNRE